MRNSEQLKDIRKNLLPTGQIDNFLSDEERKSILEYFKKQGASVVRKPTGPRVLNIENFKDFEWLTDKLKDEFGNFDVWSMQIFDVLVPHVIHNDDHESLPNSYKTFLFPLEYEPPLPNNPIEFITFEQYCFAGEYKFFNDDKGNFPVYKNASCKDYSIVEGLNDKGIDPLVVKKLSHLKKQWLNGLSIDKVHKWLYNSVIHFHPCQLHCSANFLASGIRRKVGMSIFTAR
jgi:hypothetical protein